MVGEKTPAALGPWGLMARPAAAQLLNLAPDDESTSAGASNTISINSLPDELLVHILRFVGDRFILTLGPQVSHRFRQLCFGILVSFRVKVVDEGTGKPAPPCSPDEFPATINVIRSTDVRQVVGWLHRLVRRFRVAQLPPLIGELSPFSAELNDHIVVSLLLGCGDLREFELGWAQGMPVDRSIDVADCISKNCRRLWSIALWRDLPDSSIIELASGCPDLRRITIKATTWITDDTLVGLAKHCPKMKAVSLVCVTDKGGTLSDVGIISLARMCPQLTELSMIDGIIAYTDKAFLALGVQCGGLMILRFGRPLDHAAVTDKGVIALAKGCPALKIVSFSGPTSITDAGVTALSEGCRGLEKICLHASFVTDDGVEDLVKGCKHLCGLDLSETVITDRAIESLLLHCTKLYALDCFRCNFLTDVSVDRLLQNKHRSIVLGLSDCSRISEAGLERLYAVFSAS